MTIPGETALRRRRGQTLRQKDGDPTTLWRAIKLAPKKFIFQANGQRRGCFAQGVSLYFVRQERMETAMEKKTPLYDRHVALGGKIVPFAGYLLPVEYPGGVIAEHMAVREACGLFDVSHMGEVLLEGPGALASLNHLLTNDYTNLAIGRVRYSPMCNAHGGVVDDLIVYRLGEERWFVVVNAANRDKDVAHMRANLLPETKLTDISDRVAQLALQGPKSREILAGLLPEQAIPEKYYSFQTQPVTVCGVSCLVSRTGYTGSLGYELYCDAQDGPALWDGLLEAGNGLLIPCGLGARDTLRLEAAMPLYGHEMDDGITPLEAGLDFAVKLQKPEFIGKEALTPPRRVRVGLRATGRGILREHQTVFLGETEIGHTTSGTYCPYLKGSYAMALVTAGVLQTGDAVEVLVRNRRVAAEVVPLPFYSL